MFKRLRPCALGGYVLLWILRGVDLSQIKHIILYMVTSIDSAGSRLTTNGSAAWQDMMLGIYGGRGVHLDNMLPS